MYVYFSLYMYIYMYIYIYTYTDTCNHLLETDIYRYTHIERYKGCFLTKNFALLPSHVVNSHGRPGTTHVAVWVAAVNCVTVVQPNGATQRLN